MFPLHTAALLTGLSSIYQLIDILKKPSAENSESSDLCGSLSTGSVIVYVWRQHDAEVIAENIEASGVSGGVVVYHGGMDSASRAKAQSRVSLILYPFLLFHFTLRLLNRDSCKFSFYEVKFVFALQLLLSALE